MDHFQFSGRERGETISFLVMTKAGYCAVSSKLGGFPASAPCIFFPVEEDGESGDKYEIFINMESDGP